MAADLLGRGPRNFLVSISVWDIRLIGQSPARLLYLSCATPYLQVERGFFTTSPLLLWCLLVGIALLRHCFSVA